MARAGLGDAWRCLFANDFSAMKVATYEANWGAGDIKCQDIAELSLADLPRTAVDLSWASFPCQDLSLAGEYRGLGREEDGARTRSGTFWPFWRLMRQLVDDGRAPRLIVLENVYGCLTSHGGRDFTAIATSIAQAGYRFGAVIMNAVHFVPQSRARLFFVAARNDMALPKSLVRTVPDAEWHPAALVNAFSRLPPEVNANWLWWDMPRPAARNLTFGDIIEDNPTSVSWHTAAETRRLLGLMTPLHLKKVEQVRVLGGKHVGAVYRRTRIDENGAKVQRAEVRFDDVAGCLRTPAGGSSRQTILVVEGRKTRSRLLSTREAARLMGLSDDYRLPPRYNDAYHVCGDGVCAPVVRHLAQNILEPVIKANRKRSLAAAAE